MRLNLDCVRDILLTVERCIVVDDQGCVHMAGRAAPYEEDFGYMSENIMWTELIGQPELTDYTKADILYTLQKLIEAEYISVHEYSSEPNAHLYYFTDNDGITFSGHQFLANVRDKGVWKTVKQKLSRHGADAALSVVSGVAAEVITRVLSGGN